MSDVADDESGIPQDVIEALQYAEDVVAGRITACHFVKLACQRHLDDLVRAADPDSDWPYRFDPEKAARPTRFIELMPHIKGQWAARRERIRLEPWQKFIETTIYGWVHKETGLRRFRTAYEEVARKNAKSTRLSAIGLYMLAADGEAGPEVYTAASKKDQAKIVLNDARQMAGRTPDYRSRWNVEVFAHSVACNDNGGKFTALDGEGKTQDGWNVHCAICDELHAHKNRALYDVLETGMGSRAQPLMRCITTAGYDQSGVCYEVRSYAVKVLEGTIEDDSFFAIIFTLDKGDDWTDPKVWIKANPNLGVSTYEEQLERLCLRAQKSPAFQNTFLTKHMNVWVNAATAWMNMQRLKDCADESLKIEDFEGEDCKGAVDLATKIDIASKLRVFVREIDGVDHYYAFGTHYLPEDRVHEEGVNDSYAGWAHEGWLTTTPGDVIDIDTIEREILDDADRFVLTELAFDPWQAQQMANHLIEAGIDCVEVKPTVANFSEPMKELEALVRSGRFHYDGCPVLTWMFSNVVAYLDAKDNIFPRKEQPDSKIDGIVALLMALARLVKVEDEGPSMYENEDSAVM